MAPISTFEPILLKIHQNLLILLEREAKYASNAPLDLLNQIDDHRKAIELTKRAQAGELSETEWREALKPLLVAIGDRSTGEASSSVSVGDIEGGIYNSIIAGGDVHVTYVVGSDRPQVDKKTIPPLPYEPETILIPAGTFWLGSEPAENVSPWETPSHKIELPAYRIGKYPVTNEQFFEFVKKTNRSVVPEMGWKLARVGKAPAPDKLKHPVVGVSWDEALAYCRWLQEQTQRLYRLPTEAEWEKAARGSRDRRVYPWGDEWQENRCHREGNQTTPVDRYPAQQEHGSGPDIAVYDLVGNSWEWTSTLWGNEYAQPDFPYPYQPDDGRESLAANPLHREYRICRGGSYLDEAGQLKCSARLRVPADEHSAQGGFRVVLELK